MFNFLNESINVEGHGLAVGALVNMFSTDVVDATASKAAPLGNENRTYLWRFHEPLVIRVH